MTLSEKTGLRLPLPLWLSLLGITAAGAIAWGTTRNDVTRNTDDIRALQADGRATRELLLRIDERTAEIKRQLDRPGR